ncbi:hypothetical protein AAIH05_34205, partial [Pseudomonas aeruginosa]
NGIELFAPQNTTGDGLGELGNDRGRLLGRCPTDFQAERHRLYGFEGGSLIHARIPKRALQPRIKADEVADIALDIISDTVEFDLRGVELFLRAGCQAKPRIKPANSVGPVR